MTITGSTTPVSAFVGDAWLDADAVWRVAEDSRRNLEGVVIEGVLEEAVGWFSRSGGVWALTGDGEAEGGGGSRGPWKAFSTREVNIYSEGQSEMGSRKTRAAVPRSCNVYFRENRLVFLFEVNSSCCVDKRVDKLTRRSVNLAFLLVVQFELSVNLMCL